MCRCDKFTCVSCPWFLNGRPETGIAVPDATVSRLTAAVSVAAVAAVVSVADVVVSPILCAVVPLSTVLLTVRPASVAVVPGWVCAISVTDLSVHAEKNKIF